MNKAVFLDRDGVINKVIFRNGNTRKPIAPWSKEEFSLIPDIKDSLFNLKNDGFKLFVVTNQPDIAKGIIDNSFVVEMNEMILKYLPIDEIRFCPHSNMDECDCRKPKPGMILGLADKWNIDCQNFFPSFDVFTTITNQERVLAFNIPFISQIEDHTWFWFTTVTFVHI